jgi:hypothetical protein
MKSTIILIRSILLSLQLDAQFRLPDFQTNAKYFTTRTDEYPGPGIIPAIGRSIYVGFGAKF